MWGVSMRICAYAHGRTLIFILLITNNTTRFFEKNFLREKMIFLRKNYFRNGLKLCAHAHMRMVSPHILFFHLHTFFRREMSAVLSVFCCSAAFCGLFRCGLCCVLFGVFFWVFVCCFLIPGLYGGLFGDSDLFCGVF